MLRCGSGDASKTDPNRNVTQYPLISEIEIADYPLGDQGCQSSNEDISVADTTLTNLTAVPKEFAKISESNRTLTGIRSQGGLKNSIVELTSYDELWDRQCPWEGSQDGRVCNDPKNPGSSPGWTLRGNESPLRVCTTSPRFTRRTQERVALHALTAVEQAYSYYTRRSTDPIDPITIQIFPKFRTVFTGAKSNSGDIVNKAYYIASNLVYFAAGDRADQKGSIAVLPEKRAEASEERPALWESDFAAAHEFGHHIQRMQLRRAKSLNSLLSWNPLGHRYVDQTETALFSGGSSFSALAESFADLTAFYALGENSNLIESLPCFGYNRNPLQAAFYEGTPKIYSASIQATFDQNNIARALRPSTREDAQFFAMDSCSQPVFTSPHDISAIYSYNLNRMFESVAVQLQPNSAQERSAIKYRMTLAWSKLSLSRLDQRKGTQSSDEFLRLIIGTAEDSVLNLSKDQYGVTPQFSNWCQLRKEGFPTLVMTDSAAGCH